MGQYRVIVVDDEEEIREGIIRKIDWNALGYEVVGSAENGVEALELAEHLHPDVIMLYVYLLMACSCASILQKRCLL